MRKLLNSFAVILIVVITIFSLLVSFAIAKNNYSNAQIVIDKIADRLPNAIENYENNLRRMVFEIFPEHKNVQSMKDFFHMDLSTYYSQQLSKDVFQFFPKDIQNLYLRYDDIDGIIINLEDYESIYNSTEDNKMGRKVKGMPDLSNKLVFSRPVTQFESYRPLGNIFMLIDNKHIDNIIAQENVNYSPSVFLLSESGQVKYTYNKGSGDKLEAELIERYNHKEGTPIDSKNLYLTTEKTFQNGETLIVAMNKKDLQLKSFETYAAVVAIGTILNAILLFTLFRFFGEYELQVSDILDSMNKIREGEVGRRISTVDKEAELSEISLAINETLDSINLYIEQIYALEIQQQDINLRALQSQINPHFLYNTLEFIRMYAVNEGVDELADIVYTFSTLLRNNISLEKQTTIEKELEFCENYVYLHQMRYPNRIAYKFKIEEGLEDVLLPKFTLQPLIENYFIHGIDYTSVDNALSVEVYRKDGNIEIEVKDNGKGMSISEAQKLQTKLDESVFNVNEHNTVGLLNVHQRLKVFLQDLNYKIKIINNNSGGLTILIAFKEEDMYV